MTTDGIIVRGAREHNLKSVDVEIPRNRITVVTGLSGSGKSSLAFDTIFAEGQRRYIESLSAFARSFMEQMKKPDVDSITGLSPSVAIDQKSISHNPRSTVGTVSEAYDYLRLLFARVGTPRCPVHNIPVRSQRPQQIVDEVLALPSGKKLMILAPMFRGKKGEFMAEFQKWARKGFSRVRADGEWLELASPKKLHRHKAHDIDVLIDRLVTGKGIESRLKESVNLALSLADGLVMIEVVGGESKVLSIHQACPECGYSFPELDPKFFSFNNPRGACETCNGLGTLDIEEHESEIQLGAGDGPRSIKTTEWSYRGAKVNKDDDEEDSGVDEYAIRVCPDCQGSRLKPEVLAVEVGSKNIAEIARLPVSELLRFLSELRFDSRDQMIAEKIHKQLISRITYMDRVGVGYLSLDRPTRTLSGGEAQRIRLATQVGSSLVGVLYVLDEPSIGLHPRDHHRLLEILKEIRDRGNTILMVEHDEDTMHDADHLIDLGPRAGKLGGVLSAQGTPAQVAKSDTLTGKYLSGRLKIEVPQARRPGHGLWLEVKGARGNNLKNVDLKIPLGTLTGITGVSGSGKSTLVIDTLYRYLARKFNDSSLKPAEFDKVTGLENLDRVIEINQKPIGRTPRSVPATYVGLFPTIRDLFSTLPDAKVRGYKPGHFSFNVKGGRCESCQGAGHIRVAMHFMADVFVRCETCQGLRYSREILQLKYRDKSIADVLGMTVAEAEEFFRHHKLVHRKLATLLRVGLDYMTLGQSSTTLSGGEAQRVKLSRELSKRATGKTLYILDEPTTGLHFDDIRRLVELLHELVNQGNTVVVIEHHIDVIKNCDYVIDLGPDGGKMGGEIVAQGTPESVALVSRSQTAPWIARALSQSNQPNTSRNKT